MSTANTMNTVVLRLEGIASYTSPLICGINIMKGESIRLPDFVAARIAGLSRQTDEDSVTIFYFRELDAKTKTTYDLTTQAVMDAYRANPQDAAAVTAAARGEAAGLVASGATDFLSAMKAAGFESAPSLSETEKQLAAPPLVATPIADTLGADSTDTTAVGDEDGLVVVEGSDKGTGAEVATEAQPRVTRKSTVAARQRT